MDSEAQTTTETNTPVCEPTIDLVDAALDAEFEQKKAQTKTDYAKRGIPFGDYPQSAEDVARRRASRLEEKALESRESTSLRSRLVRVLSAGAYVDDDGACSPERALLRYAAATTKAAGLALMGARYVRSNENFELEFSDEDAAIVMCGLSELLEVGPELIDSVSYADARASKAEAAE